MKAILLSIRPEYVEKILDGSKKYEYRRRLAKTRSDIILIYSTAPVMRVVAQAQVLETIKDTPDDLWESTKEKAGISKERYQEYFEGCVTACAYRLGKVQVFDEPKPLAYYDVLLPPQSFKYIEL